MKKHLGNLLFAVAAIFCMAALFTCNSIDSKAAATKAVKNLKFVGGSYSYVPATTGYYTEILMNETTVGSKYVVSMYQNCYRTAGANVVVLPQRDTMSSIKPGKLTIYIVGSTTKLDHTYAKDYLADKSSKITEYSSTLKEKTPAPKGVTLNDSPVDSKYSRISWQYDGCAHYYHVKWPAHPGDKYSFIGFSNDVAADKNYFDFDKSDIAGTCDIFSYSSDLNTYADSDTVKIVVPASDLTNLYDKGSYTLDLSDGKTTITDKNCTDPLRGTLAAMTLSGGINISIDFNDSDNAKLDLDKDGTMDISANIGDKRASMDITVLPSNSIKNRISLTMTAAAKDEAIDYGMDYYNVLTFVFEKSSAKSGKSGAATLNGKPVDNGNLLMVVTVDGITYMIDKNGTAIATDFASMKKASINQVTVDGKTYPVVAIADNACKSNKKLKNVTIGSNVTSIGKNAFKSCKKLKKVTIKANKSLKISKGAFKNIAKSASFKIKGVKGKAKKKLLKAIKK